MRESLKTGSQEEVLSMKSSVVKQVKQLTITFPPEMLKPSAEASVVFSALADVTTACRSYGRVSTRDALPDSLKCYATGIGVEAKVVGEMSIAALYAINYDGHPCKEPIQSTECELVSELIGTTIQGKIEGRGQNQYEISYQPNVKGRHQLHVKIEGQHIRANPFTISAKSSVEKLGTLILTVCGVWGPWGVAINQRGEVIVAEWTGYCVSIFSSNGDKIRTFGTRGSGQGQFEHPRGVAVDDDGNIFVADADNDRIQKFTPEGQFLAAVGSRGKGFSQFSSPSGIAFNSANKMVYIADSENHRIQVLNSDLTFGYCFGKLGSGMGKFDHPYGIACSSTGKVYVADWYNHHIQVFTGEGMFLRVFGWRGDGMRSLLKPVGVALDSNDTVYVSERDNHRVSVFTSEGRFVTSFGSYGVEQGVEPGQLSSPRGVAVDNCGVVYVCDLVDNLIHVF